MGSGGSGIVAILMVILAVLWILVPVAIFGIRGVLREILVEQKRTNELLSNRSLEMGAAAVPAAKIPEFQPPKRGLLG